jgi:uncharacterized damage-inducible protein DinB
MKISELYPYWDGVHEEFVEMLEALPEPEWRSKICSPGLLSIRQIVLNFITTEREWIGAIAARRPFEPAAERDFPTGQSLVEGVQATRAATEHYLRTMDRGSLSSVRTVPPDPAQNRQEYNTRLSCVIWHVMTQEVLAYGQVSLRRHDLRTLEG